MVGSRDAHVWHCSLSLHPDEPGLSDERWSELCEQFVAAMGFAGEAARAQHRWVAVRHGRSTGGSDHVHLVEGLIAEDGSKARLRTTGHARRRRLASWRRDSGCGGWRPGSGGPVAG
jgi:hypothetical protein